MPIAIDRAWGRGHATSRTRRGTSSRTPRSASVREMVGLDQVEFAITGAAPIPAELLEWFQRDRRAALRDLRHVRVAAGR